MQCWQTWTMMLCVVGVAVPQSAHAALLPSISAQVDEVSRWFTGDFDNSAQVSLNPSIPFVPLSTCSVQVQDVMQPIGTQSLYLAQPTLNRFRLYSFEPAIDTITLSIRSFINPSSFSGICEQPLVNRVVSQSNLASAVCQLTLFRELDRYSGSNAPAGCPTSTGGKVVSTVTFQRNSTFSLDQIFSRTGQLLVGTPIEFRRVKSTPEPTVTIGLMLAGLSLTQLRRSQPKAKSSKR